MLGNGDISASGQAMFLFVDVGDVARWEILVSQEGGLGDASPIRSLGNVIDCSVRWLQVLISEGHR